jgi:hypothetical protein
MVPKVCPTPAHSSAFQRTRGHVTVETFSFDCKQLRALTETEA